MSKALSLDLRTRVLSAVSEGLSHRAVGARFGVSAVSVSRWRALEREQVDARPKALGGDRRSGRIEAQHGVILGLLEERRDITIEELRAALGARASSSVTGRYSASLCATPSREKKTAHAAEQDRPDVLSRRHAWRDGQPDLDPDRLVFIDETWAKTNMARTHGWASRGERLSMAVPHGHWNTTTFLAGLSRRGMIAPFVLPGAIDRDAFETYLKEVLVPELRTGDIVVMDTLEPIAAGHPNDRIDDLLPWNFVSSSS